MAKLTLMVGISGSGKSTKAKELALEKSALIINRDKLREMLFGYTEETIGEYYKSSDLWLLENQISSYQNYLIERALVKDKNVILDNTNLKQSYINEICKKFSSYEIDFCLVECDLKTAIERDNNRTRKVGESIIKQQYQNIQILKKNFDFKPKLIESSKAIKQDESLPKAFIFDIDGTLAKMGDRSPYDLSRVHEDQLNEPIAACLDALYDGYEIIICSGREGTQECEDLTKQWLSANGINYKFIMMRKEGDMRADYIVKEEMWQRICEDFYIVGMFDDRNQVVDHARKLGFTVFQVDYGDF